ncbi:MAG TPA: UDP-4-amino-4,6-dideoxy-N-acetyl-beta-L-altrosamine transaminase [Parafilimonas sp.]|nr:UDP-4-amino-4,6-dideoxy-N-acetyl-beta-L-altrosamine transaminase [Parafilimonas sp.]
MIPYGKQYISEEDIAAVTETLKSDFLTQGPKINEFEEKFAQYIGVKYAVAVANGTAALHLSAMALNVNKNSKVITTPITFAASANCVRYCGGEIVFADIDSATALIDIEKIKELLAASPQGTYQGIIPVDLAGYPVNLEKLRALANEYGLWIIEDACHAPGGYFTDSKGIQQKCGNCVYTQLAMFSFHPVKHIACGEGGMITTNDEELYKKLISLRTHGITKDPELMHENHGGWYYEIQELGYNYRLSDINAALGVSQLKRADANLQKRKAISKKYDNAFANNTNIKLIQPAAGFSHAYHLYIIQVENRKGLYDYLKQNNIFAQVHYIPVTTLPYYKQVGYNTKCYPNANAYYEKCLSIPMYPTLKEEEQDFVISKILEFVQ